MLKVVLSFILISIASFGVAEEEAIQPLSRHMTIWRYLGEKDFTRANVMSLRWNGERFAFDTVGEIRARPYRNRDCKSLLTYNQSLPLSVYEDREYLTHEQALFQLAVEYQVNPNRVTFTEVSNILPLSKEEFEKRFPHAQRGKALQSILKLEPMKVSEKKTSTMWMISGQTLDEDQTKLTNHNLPWQDDPELKGNPRLVVDREKFKLIFEFGRASQVDSRMVEHNLRALAILAYKDVQHLKAITGEDDGYIFVHALNASRTRLFEKIYGAKKFPEDWDQEGNCILYMKLSELMKRFKPARVSDRVASMMEMSGGIVSETQALDIQDLNLTLFRNDVDFAGDSSQPLVIEDMTFAGYKTTLLAALKSYGIEANNANRIFRLMAQNIYNRETSRPYYRDYVHIKAESRQLSQYNSVQISNVNEKMALNSEGYLPAVLGGVYNYYVDRLSRHGVDGENFVQSSEIQFGIRTKSLKVSRKLRAMGSKEISFRHGREMIYVHLFTLDQIRKMKAAKVSDGYWYSRRLLLNPQRF